DEVNPGSVLAPITLGPAFPQAPKPYDLRCGISTPSYPGFPPLCSTPSVPTPPLMNATYEQYDPEERDMTKRVLIFAGLALSLLALPGASDAGAGVTLYEISERVTFSPKKLEDRVGVFRNATDTLLGFVELGEPLCTYAP